MSTNLNWKSIYCSTRVLGATALLLVAARLSGWAQTVTSDPASGASSVSVTAPVVFTFSSAVDPTATQSSFYSVSPPGAYPVTESWNSLNTVLTCTPDAPWPANATISWAVIINVMPVPVFAQGTFSTSTNSSTGGGSGTNAIPVFTAGKLYIYEQTSTGAPSPNTNAAYGFVGSTSLASNQTASAVTLTLPSGGGPRNLMQSPLHHEDWTFFDYSSDSNAFETTYPEGDYVYNVTGTPANLQRTVTLPASMVQPNAPHIANFAEAQTVTASQPFTLKWDAFQGGTAADVITVSVNGMYGTNLFQTTNPPAAGALSGTATSVTIPSGKLPDNSTNTAEVIFFRFVAVTNGTYGTFAYRATGTEFELITGGGATSTVPVVSNPKWEASGFGFDVATTANQALKVLYSTNCSLPIAQWQILLATNSPGQNVHLTVPAQAGATGFFRLENGP